MIGKDGRCFMNYPCVVQKQRAQGMLHQKAHALRAVGIKHAGFAAFYALSCNQQYDHKVHTIAVCAFRSWAAYAASCVNSELMRFNKPLVNGLHLCEQPAKSSDQIIPGRITRDHIFHRLKPAFKPAMQGVVIRWLPMGPMRCLRERVGRHVLHKARMAALAIASAVLQMRISGQVVPRPGQRFPIWQPVSWQLEGGR